MKQKILASLIIISILLSLLPLAPTSIYADTMNLTNFTEVDPNGRITVNSTRASYTNLETTEDAYVYKDMGSGHFSDNFEHLIDVYLDDSGDGGFVVVWALANLVDDACGISAADGDELFVYFFYNQDIGSPQLVTAEGVAGDGYSDNCFVSLDTPYYLKIERDEDIGTYGRFYCYIYSDSDRTSLVDTLQLDLHEKEDFRYIYAIQTWNSGYYHIQSGYSENLDLQEVPPTAEALAATNISAHTATISGTVTDYGGGNESCEARFQWRDVAAPGSSENLTTFTEVDPNSRITVNATHASYAGLAKNEDAYVYDDMGAGHFSDNFEHLIDVYLDASDDGGYVVVWALANLVDDVLGISDADDDELYLYFYRSGSNYLLVLNELVGGFGYNVDDIISLDTPYYLKIKRDESIGTGGRLYCYIYSDSDRTSLIDTLQLDLHEKEDFRYVYAIQSLNFGTSAAQTGYSGNLNLQEGTWTATEWQGVTGLNATPNKLAGADDDTGTETPYGLFVLTKFAAETSGVMNEFRVKSSANGYVKCALYTDNGGEPGALITAMDTGQAVSGSGWETLSFTSTPITQGTIYWLAICTSASGATEHVSVGGTTRYKSATYGTFTFPNPAGSGFSYNYAIELIAGWGVISNIFSENLTSLDRATEYEFRTQAKNWVGEGNWSAPAYFETLPEIPTVTTQAATNVASTSCTGNGNITDTGGENCNTRGFCYKVGISGDPTTSDSTAYDNGGGSYGNGTYNKSITGLTPSTNYRVRAYVINSGGMGYGSTVQVTTLPGSPSSLTDTAHNGTSITLGWTKGTGADKTLIRYRTDQYPTGTSDGTEGYFDTGNTTTIESLNYGQVYYFRAWAYNTTNDLYSSGTSDNTCFTDPNNPTSFTVTETTGSSIALSWTLGTGADKTMVRYRVDQYPEDEEDGNQAYFDTGTSVNVTGLESGQIHYFRAWSYDTESGYYDSYAQVTGNTTGVETPTAITQAATNLGPTTARINGEISDDGGESCEARFRWSELGEEDWTTTSWQNSLETDDEYYEDLTGLEPGVEYEFQTQAKNGAGEGEWSESEEFETWGAIFYPNKDNFIWEKYPNNNYGSLTQFSVGSFYPGEVCRSLVEFSVDWETDIPEGATITSATLQLYYYNSLVGYDPVGRTIYAQRLLRLDWAEMTSTWNIYKTGSSWAGAGASASGSDYTSSGQAADTVPGSYGWMEWDITTQVEWARSNDENVAIRLKDSTETSGYGCKFYSKEHSTNKPTLTILYTLGAPTVTTGSASEVLDTTATLGATITDDGGDTITTRGFKYGLTQTPTWDVHETGSFGVGTYTLDVTSLSSGTMYWFKAYATNGAGTSYGSWVSFTTLGMPSITTMDASNVASTSARLNSALVSDGGDDCTIKFGWGLSSESAVEDYDTYETLPSTYNTGAYPYLDVSGLLPGYTYYFRVAATNALGTTTGDELEFETGTSISAPTNFVGYPEATSISLSWSKGDGSTNTLVRYGMAAYPGTTTAGTYIYSGPSNTYTIEGLTAGTTYYFSAWGESGGNYSASYATLLMTTSASAGPDTPDIDVPTEPSRWFSAPDYTSMAGLGLIYDGYNSVLDLGHVPRETGWFLSALVLSALLGLLAYLMFGKKMLIGMIVLTVCLAMGYFLKLIPWWIPLMTLILTIAFSMTHKQVAEG